jgi:uncharacterized protein (TIGR02444 family)
MIMAHMAMVWTQPSLWDFALAVYAAPRVADCCLALQDRHRCDVNLILFAAWSGAVHGRRLSPAEIAAAAAAVHAWHQDIVVPLRSVRRRLKVVLASAPDISGETLRAQVKAAELDAEKFELGILEQTSEAWPATPAEEPWRATSDNLMLAVRHFASGNEAEAAACVQIIADAASANAIPPSKKAPGRN